MQYTKQAIDFSDQLSLLKQRGLIIDDEDKALRCLHSISYFRLTSYLVPMESDSDTHAFRPNSHLHTAIALYNFDRKLRSLVSTSIQDIEVAVVLRNACAHHARIWNKRFPTMPTMPQRLPESWVSTNSFRPNKLYHQLCYLAYMEQSIVPNSDFTEALVKLVKDNPDIQTRSMGFPLGNWQDEPLWRNQRIIGDRFIDPKE